MGKSARGRKTKIGRTTPPGSSLHDIHELAEAARLRLLGTPWGANGRVTADGRELLLDLVRSGIILAPLAAPANGWDGSGRDQPGGDPALRDVAVGRAALFAAGLLATRGEVAPQPMAQFVEDTLRRLRSRCSQGDAR